MIDKNNKQLSPDGISRKKVMLTELVGQMNHIHSTRQTRRRVIQTFALVIICVITVWNVTLNYSSQETEAIVIGPVIESDQPLLPEKSVFVRTIDDDELIALLAKINRPAGIVRSEGQIWLTNAVTDEELGIFENVPDEDSSSM